MPMSRFSAGTRLTSAPSKRDDAGIGVLEARDHAQRRRLAATGGAQQRDELAVLDGQRQGVDDGSRTEALGEVRLMLTSVMRGDVPAGLRNSWEGHAMEGPPALLRSGRPSRE